MSDKIPIEIQMEIIQRIPDIRSVIQFRSVSKSWKSMIDSKEFVTGHTLRHIHHQPHRLLIRGQDFDDSEVKYVSIVDNDDTFPNQKLNLFVPDIYKDARLVGSSYGLFCLYDEARNMVVIWNPCIRKTVLTTTVVPYDSCRIDVVFGVCPNTLDPKIVKISNPGTKVEVFTLSLGAWRSPLSDTRPCTTIGLGYSQAVVDGFIYWVAYSRIKNGGRSPSLIMSFDLTSEEFTELYLPDSPVFFLYVSNLRESLGVFEINCDTLYFVRVWMMKGCGCTRSFEKLYDITPYDVSISRTLGGSLISRTLGFRMSGAPIVEMEYFQGGLPGAVAAYEPESKDITEICSDGKAGTFYVHSYKETLLLLGH